MTDSAIKIPSTIIVRDLATKLQLPITAVIGELMKNGIMSSVNEEVDFDTASIIAEDLGRSVELETEEALATEETAAVDYLAEDTSTDLKARAPVVVVMGHVDHGKTSLLDAIRQSDVVGGEAGGITQRIGAYQVHTHDRPITFIDTPGHEAFAQMRSRGAKIADVAILVVAADEGIKPQTEESIKIIQEMQLPFIVALTKSDKPDAQADRVKKELAEKNILAEDYGGKIPFVAVSAKTKDGLTSLLESVLLVADVESQKLMVNAARPAVGTIIESHVDPKQGAIASALVQTGTLRLGDEIIVGQVYGKVRSMKNDRGESIKEAIPSTPVQILGLKGAPQVGDILRVSRIDAQELKKKVKSHQMGIHTQSVVGGRSARAAAKEADESGEVQPELHKLFIILKTDTLGTAEAILESLKKIDHPEVAVDIIQRGLGIVSDAEVLRAEAAKAVIYGFHVSVSQKSEQLARSKGISIKTYTVIYDLIDDIVATLEAMLPPHIEEKEIGHLKVLAIFRNENTFQVIGGKVSDGSVQLGANIKVVRGDTVITTGKITQLQSNKQNVKEVAAGNECGMKVECKPVIQVGDVMTAITTESSRRKLSDRF